MKKFVLIAVMIAVSGMMFASASFARTWYVKAGATGNGYTTSTPMNIERAFADSAKAGDVVNIHGGIYSNVHPVVGHEGTSESTRITFQAWPNTGKPILIGNGTKSTSDGNAITARGKSYITIKGIRVTKYSNGIYFDRNGTNYNDACHYAIIDGCEAD